MHIAKEEAAGVSVVKISGEIDLHASPALRAELKSFLDARAAVLLLDFSEVTYIDSSGLATLIEYVRECGSFGGKFALFALQPKVRTIFDLVRLNELFVISATSEDALAQLGIA